MVDIKTTIAFYKRQLNLNRVIIGIYLMSRANVNTIEGRRSLNVKKAQPVLNSWWRSW